MASTPARPELARPPDDQPLPPTPGAPGEPPPVVVRAPVDIRNLSLSVLAVIAVILLLQYAQSVFIPIVLAILISYSLDPAVAGLAKYRISRSIGAAIVLTAVLGVLGFGVYELSDQFGQIVNQVPAAAQRIRERVRAHRAERGGVVERMQQAAKEVEKTANEASPTEATPGGVQRVQVVEPSFSLGDYVWSGGMNLISFSGQVVLVVFLAYFFMVTGDLYKRKLVKIAGPTISDKKVTVQILDEISLQIASFMRVQVLTSALVAIATAAALWWLGLQEYLIWGVFAGVFNSIPYLGPVIVTGGLGLVAFMQFDSIQKTVVICAVAFIITSLEGFLLTPALLSRAARINSAAIFTGLLFWSWIWGVWGTILAVPMLMMIKAVCDHVEDLQPIGELLGE
jgi:predicted PurR-regulated permease PerM